MGHAAGCAIRFPTETGQSAIGTCELGVKANSGGKAVRFTGVGVVIDLAHPAFMIGWYRYTEIQPADVDGKPETWVRAAEGRFGESNGEPNGEPGTSEQLKRHLFAGEAPSATGVPIASKRQLIGLGAYSGKSAGGLVIGAQMRDEIEDLNSDDSYLLVRNQDEFLNSSAFYERRGSK